MKALDTNVLARWVLRDDHAQAVAADAILRDPCHVPLSVMLELGWVLGKSLRLPRKVVAAMLERILDLEGIAVENASGLRWSLERYRAGADWADAVHVIACAQTASAFATFDNGLVRKLKTAAPIPIQLIET